MEKQTKKYFTLGCCGIDCGLCPRYYTDGESRCPGCFGENFSLKHPPCGVASCCVKKNNLDACGQCNDFPCKKYEGDNVLKDSFVTHQKMMDNQKYIQINGIEKFIKEQNIRVKLLENILSNYNDGKNKSYFCTATALLDVVSLKKAVKEAEIIIKNDKIPEHDLKIKSKVLKNIIEKYAEENGIVLKLRK